MKNRILEIFEELMVMKSVTYSEKENEIAEYFGQFFRKLPYFQINPEYTGVYQITGDPFGRTIPYGFLKGKSNETVILSGHFDVVSTEEYGSARNFAHSPGEGLEKKLALMDLNERARKDLESGEWIWGRGSCDMKGGLAIHASLFEEYANMALEGNLEGSIIFMLVPDEESYSAGMRSGAHLLKELKDKYGLRYKLMIDPEPTALAGQNQVMSIGSVGKCMPAVLVQGKKGHAGHFFEGLSAISVLSSIFSKINGSLEFCDVYEKEMTVPPTWFKMRDMKEVYDVSIPHRAFGYFTVFSLITTPEDIIDKVKKISKEAFLEESAKIDAAYNKFKEVTRTIDGGVSYEPMVITFSQLRRKLQDERGDEFENFYSEAKQKIVSKINQGTLNYPDATIKLMEKVLDFSAISRPVVLIGFAPPYYMPVHGDKVKHKENYGTKAFEFVSKISKEYFNQTVIKENYFMGISDLSYSAVTSPFDYESYVHNTVLWGSSYSIDFDCIEDIAVPSVIYGPVGLEYHQFTERVNKKSMLEVVPYVTKKLVEYMWRL